MSVQPPPSPAYARSCPSCWRISATPALEAVDGSAALKVLQSDVRLDLLVTDVGPPGGMNGPQVADAGRVARPGLKVLFITGYAENAVLDNGHLDPGMQALIKPFATEALASRIKEPAARTSCLSWRVLGRVSRLPLEFVRALQAPIDQFI